MILLVGGGGRAASMILQGAPMVTRPPPHPRQSPNGAAEQYIDQEVLDNEIIYPTAAAMQRLEFIEDTGDFEIEYTDALSRARS